MSDTDLAALGAPDIVYIVHEGKADKGVRLCGADGSLLGEFETEAAALGVVKLNALSLTQVH